MVLVIGSKSWQTNNADMEVKQELRKAIAWLKDDLIQGGFATVVGVPADGNPYTSITFNKAAGVSNGSVVWSATPIQYIRGGTGSTQLLRIAGGQTKVIAQDIQTLNFRRQNSSPNVVEVTVQCQKSSAQSPGVSVSSVFKVNMRN